MKRIGRVLAIGAPAQESLIEDEMLAILTRRAYWICRTHPQGGVV